MMHTTMLIAFSVVLLSSAAFSMFGTGGGSDDLMATRKRAVAKA